MKPHVKIYIICFISVVALVLLNEVNLTYIQPDFPYKNGLITTADEYSYFSPVDQFVKTLNWSQNADGEKAFIRTPGYSYIYLLAKILGGTNAFILLKILQIAFFTGSILFFSKILQSFNLSKNLILAGTAIYGLLPCFSGFTYYTLSESVLPFFVLWASYALFRVERDKFISLNLIFSCGMLILVRPQMILLPLIFLIYFIIKRKKISLSLLIALIPLIVWNIRTITITGEWLGFHPIYSKMNNSLYREPHKEMTALFRVWEFRGDLFHTSIGQLSKDTTETTRNLVLQSIPVKYRSSVKPILKDFQEFRFYQQTVSAGKRITSFLPGEEKLIQKIQSTRKLLISKNTFDYYIKTPVKSFKKLMVTSMMNLYVFQEPWKDNVFVLILKYFSFFIISLGFISTFYLLFHFPSIVVFLSALTVISSIFYLSFFQRFNEERYLLPYMSLMLIHLLLFADIVWNKRKKATH